MDTLPTVVDGASSSLTTQLERARDEVREHEQRLDDATRMAMDLVAQHGHEAVVAGERNHRRQGAAGVVRLLRRRLRRLREDVDAAWLTVQETFGEVARLRVAREVLSQEVEQLRTENARLSSELRGMRHQAQRSHEEVTLATSRLHECMRERDGYRDALERAQRETELANRFARARTADLRELEDQHRRLRDERNDLAFMLSWVRAQERH
ncbi:MAG: hypothetical protein AB2A00_40310 [Myxococcota bacterium]